MKKSKLIICISIVLVLLLAVPLLAFTFVGSSDNNDSELDSRIACNVYNCPTCPPVPTVPETEASPQEDLPQDLPQGMTPELPPIGEQPDQPHRGGLCRKANCQECRPSMEIQPPSHPIGIACNVYGCRVC